MRGKGEREGVGERARREPLTRGLWGRSKRPAAGGGAQGRLRTDWMLEFLLRGLASLPPRDPHRFRGDLNTPGMHMCVHACVCMCVCACVRTEDRTGVHARRTQPFCGAWMGLQASVSHQYISRADSRATALTTQDSVSHASASSAFCNGPLHPTVAALRYL